MKLTHDEVIKVVEYENNQNDSYYTYYTQQIWIGTNTILMFNTVKPSKKIYLHSQLASTHALQILSYKRDTFSTIKLSNKD